MLWLLCAALSFAASPDEVQNVARAANAYRPARQAVLAPTLPADVYKKAANGQIPTGLSRVEGYAARQAWAVAVIDQDVDTVWAALRDFGTRTDYSKVEYAQVQVGEACVSGRQIFQYLRVPMVSDRWWVSTIKHNEAIEKASNGRAYEMYFSASTDKSHLLTPQSREWAAKGVPVGSTQGAYFIYAINDHSTVVEYYLMSEPGGYVPTSIANAFATGGVHDALESLGELAEAGPGCTNK